MKIVFWGTPKFAAYNLQSIINAGHNIIGVVTQPDRKRGRGKSLSPSPVKQIALDNGLPVYTTSSIKNDKVTQEILFNLKADVYLVVAFGQILPQEILDCPKQGCWNSHASLLPKWRGAAPIQWSLINDDTNSGVCIMAMELGLDTGPIIDSESTEINDIDNLEILTSRLSKISSKLLIKFLENLELSVGLNKKQILKKLNSIDQSNLQVNPSYARQISKEDYRIDWNQSARKIFKMIQGLYPNAYTLHNGKRIKVIEAFIINDNINSIINKSIDYKVLSESIIDSTPGQVIMIIKQVGIIIMTTDYPILIVLGQLEGKKNTDGYTLSLQSNLSVKDNFLN